MTHPAYYRDKVAVVTGGASGIGAALAQELGKLGASVVIADRQLDLAESVVSKIHAGGGRAVATELDVRDPAAVKRVVEETLGRWQRIDFFFNNAGIGVGGDASELSTDDYDDVFDVNLRGVAYGVQAVYPVMLRQGSGHIVNTASMAGLVATAGQVAYSASKHAVVGLSKALRVEARGRGVRVSVLCPGVIRTPILRGGKYGRFHGGEAVRERVEAMFERMRPMPSDVFARRALAAVARNAAIIIEPAWWKLFWYLERLAPAASLALMSKGYQRTRDQAQSQGDAQQSAPEEVRAQAARAQATRN